MFNKWLQNSDLENLNFNLSILADQVVPFEQAQRSQILVFSHVPKTGGTSLESVLSKNYLMARQIHINAPDLNRSPELLALKKQPPQLLCGHHPLHGYMYQCLPRTQTFHVTMLREPVFRVLSFYNYLKGKTDHPLHPTARDLELTDFLKKVDSPEIHNGQARRFSGYLHSDPIDDDALAAQAIANLKQHFTLVFTTECFDQGILLLKNALNLSDVYYHHHNRSKRHIIKDELKPEVIAQIKTLNQADEQVHHWAHNQLQEIYTKHLTAECLAQFQKDQKKWIELQSSHTP